MADDPNAAMRRFLATEPGSLGLADKLKQLEEENAALEAELAKVEKNRDAILREKRLLQGKPEKALRGNGSELFITAEDSRDPSEYQRMKAVAAQQGKTLRIVGEDIPSGAEKRSPVKFVEDRDAGVLYANAAVRDRVGIQRLQEIAQERGLKTSKTFRYPHELPDHLQRQHAQTLADRAVDSLVDHD